MDTHFVHFILQFIVKHNAFLCDFMENVRIANFRAAFAAILQYYRFESFAVA